jgi:hypothetical protein
MLRTTSVIKEIILEIYIPEYRIAFTIEFANIQASCSTKLKKEFLMDLSIRNRTELNEWLQHTTEHVIPSLTSTSINTSGNVNQVSVWDFKFSRQRIWSSESSGMYCRVLIDIQLRTRQYIPKDSELQVSVVTCFDRNRSSSSSSTELKIEAVCVCHTTCIHAK